LVRYLDLRNTKSAVSFNPTQWNIEWKIEVICKLPLACLQFCAAVALKSRVWALVELKPLPLTANMAVVAIETHPRQNFHELTFLGQLGAKSSLVFPAGNDADQHIGRCENWRTEIFVEYYTKMYLSDSMYDVLANWQYNSRYWSFGKKYGSANFMNCPSGEISVGWGPNEPRLGSNLDCAALNITKGNDTILTNMNCMNRTFMACEVECNIYFVAKLPQVILF